MNKQKEIFELSKIPDEVIISQLKIEIGKLKSYIQELEDRNRKLEKTIKLLQKELKKREGQLENDVLREMKKDAVLVEYRKQHKANIKDFKSKIQNLQVQIKKLQADNSQLITRLHAKQQT